MNEFFTEAEQALIRENLKKNTDKAMEIAQKRKAERDAKK